MTRMVVTILSFSFCLTMMMVSCALAASHLRWSAPCRTVQTAYPQGLGLRGIFSHWIFQSPWVAMTSWRSGSDPGLALTLLAREPFWGLQARSELVLGGCLFLALSLLLREGGDDGGRPQKAVMASASVTRIALKAVIVTFSIPFLEAGSMWRHSRAAALRQHPIRAFCLPTLCSRPVCSETIEAEFRFAVRGGSARRFAAPGSVAAVPRIWFTIRPDSGTLRVAGPVRSNRQRIWGNDEVEELSDEPCCRARGRAESPERPWRAALGHPVPWQMGLQGAASPVAEDIHWFHNCPPAADHHRHHALRARPCSSR